MILILRPLKEPLYNAEKKITGESSGVSWYQGKKGVWMIEERNGFEMSRTFFPSAPNKNWTAGRQRKFKALIRHARTVDWAAKRRRFEAEVESYHYFKELPFWKRPEKEPKLFIQNDKSYPIEDTY